MALHYLSDRPVTLPPRSPGVLAVVRNEILRLPYFLAFYRARGVERFLFIDNGSTDGGRDYLLAQPDCFLFQTGDSYAGSNFGLSWTNEILDRYCDGSWVVVVDADELLVWPGSETESLPQLARRLEALGAEALFTILLDMYSERSFGEIAYRPGEDFLAATPFFDRGPYQVQEAQSFPYRQIYGGVRDRVFRALGTIRFHSPTASKVPLVRWRAGQKFVLSTHGLLLPMRLAPMRGALLHFKMFDDLYEKCRVEVARGEHFDKAREYRVLGAAIERAARRSFVDPAISVRYSDTAGLTALGLLDSAAPF